MNEFWKVDDEKDLLIKCDKYRKFKNLKCCSNAEKIFKGKESLDMLKL